MLTPGQTLGNYVVQDPIAAGGMGVVYRARHATLGTPLALKVLLSNYALNPTVRERFRREAQVQAGLRHPNIVRVTDLVETPQVLALAMDLVEGPSLEHVIAEERPGPWRWPAVRAVLFPVTDAVATAHGMGVAHRDLKPANILLDRGVADGGGAEVAKVTDFGLAKLLQSSGGMTRTGTRMGTLPYMAPEQYTGQKDVDARADVFALGMLAWRLVTGALPVDPENMSAVHELYAGHRPLPPVSTLVSDAPSGLDAVLASALALDPADRPADARALLQRLETVGKAPVVAVLAAEEAAPAPDEQPRNPAPPVRAPVEAGDDRWLGPAVVFGVLLLVGLLFAGFGGNEKPTRSDQGPAVEATSSEDPNDAKKERRPNPAGIDWISMPEGTYWMGSASGDSDEHPPHAVTLSSFEIGKTEVTVAQYAACVRSGGCTAPGSGEHCNSGQAGRKQHPVNCVDHGQASTFCDWAGGRLPTEAEWEYAATSGGKEQEYPWGDEAASCARAVMDDGGPGCGKRHTLAVCSRPSGRSAQGVCDLSGNVWEWVSDWYGNYPSARQQNPKGPSSGSYRVNRGSGWDYADPSYLRAGHRSRYSPGARDAVLGFRCARR